MPNKSAPDVPFWKRLFVGACVLATAVPFVLWAPLPWAFLWFAVVAVVVWLVGRALGLPKGWYWPNWREQTRMR
jgi:hypothetical protein